MKTLGIYINFTITVIHYPYIMSSLLTSFMKTSMKTDINSTTVFIATIQIDLYSSKNLITRT